MLDELHVRNIALIKDACFTPDSHLTVLTGETGAGKTALLSSLKLITGQRADVSALREGADEALVEGRFFDDVHEDGCVVMRKLGSDGRSRASIDGSMCSLKQLAAEIGSCIDICGQHEHQRLLKPAYHVQMLDLWAADSITEPLAQYQAAFDAHRVAAENLQRLMELQSSSHVALDEARYTMSRIDEVSPVEGEYEELLEQMPRIEHMEMLLTSSHEAYAALTSDSGALDSVHVALSRVEAMAEIDTSLASVLDSLYTAAYALEDVAREVRAYKDNVDFSPEAFNEAQERMSALQGLMRSFGPRMEDVFEARRVAAELVDMADHSDEHVHRAQQELDRAEAALVSSAEVLEATRKKVAPLFADEVTKHMGRLNMSGAQLLCNFESLPRASWTKEGSTKMEFQYRVGAGMTPRPLARIASGGEVSRVMLACKVTLGEADDRETLIFDEVDAGVGGATAVALADVLEDLSHTHQVIVITHLASVAVKAAKHYVVRKQAGDIPETILSVVEGEDRVCEIARMLSGDEDDVTRAHARQMLGM